MNAASSTGARCLNATRSLFRVASYSLTFASQDATRSTSACAAKAMADTPSHGGESNSTPCAVLIVAADRQGVRSRPLGTSNEQHAARRPLCGARARDSRGRGAHKHATRQGTKKERELCADGPWTRVINEHRPTNGAPSRCLVAPCSVRQEERHAEREAHEIQQAEHGHAGCE